MRIALIANYWLDSQGGGVREYNVNLINELKKNGHDIFVIFREGEDSDNRKIVSGKYAFTSGAIVNLINFKPDVILTQGGWFTQFPALRYKGSQKKVKIINFHHSVLSKAFPFYKRFIYENIWNRFDYNVFVSNYLKKNIRNYSGVDIRTNTEIIYPGVRIRDVSSKELMEFKNYYNFNKEDNILLCQGLTSNFEKAKGVKLLIETIKTMNDPRLRIIVTRNGQYVPDLRKYANNMKMTKQVIFTGEMENPMIPVEACSIFTHITFAEGGVSIAILEAMAKGKPIIASNVGGIPEAIENGKSGILVRNDKNEIRGSLERILSDGDLRNLLGKNAATVAQTKFTWENTVKALITTIE